MTNTLLDEYSFVERTEAGGKLYVHNTNDTCAVEYRNYIKFFSRRKEGFGNYPCQPIFFKDCDIVDVQQ